MWSCFDGFGESVISLGPYDILWMFSLFYVAKERDLLHICRQVHRKFYNICRAQRGKTYTPKTTLAFLMSFLQMFTNLNSSDNNWYLMTMFFHIHFFGHMSVNKIEGNTKLHDAGKHYCMFWHCNITKFYFYPEFNENNFLTKIEQVQNCYYFNAP